MQGEAALGYSSVSERRLLLEGLQMAFYPTHPRVVRASVALGRLLAGFGSVGGGTQKEDAPGQGVVGVDDGGEGTAG